MSIFNFSSRLGEEFEKIIRYFWWVDDMEKRDVHWMAWDKIMKPKYQGRVGFRVMRAFNQVLLEKQARRYIEYPYCLCAKLPKEKYSPSRLIDTTFIQKSSRCWQGIVHGIELLKHGMLWRISTREKVKIWRDNWIPIGSLKTMGKSSRNKWKWVSDLIEPTRKIWNEDLVRKIFYPPDTKHIIKIQLPSFSCEYYLGWF
jgi:hypothetical protein